MNRWHLFLVTLLPVRSNSVRNRLYGLFLLIGLAALASAVPVAGFLFEPLQPETAQAAQSAASPTPTPLPPMAEVIVDSLPVRSCPAEACAKIGTVPGGEQVELLGCVSNGSWCQINLADGQSGWAESSSLEQLNDTRAGPTMGEGEGEKIAFLSTRDHLNEPSPGYELYLMNSDGAQQSSIKPMGLSPYSCTLAWLPQQRQLFYTDCGGSSKLVNLSDGAANPWLFPGSGDGSSVQFSPDGDQMAYVQRDNSTWNILVARIDGTNPQQLTDFSDNEVANAPSWSPDGEKLAFGLQSGGSANSFWVMNADGSEKEKLADVFARLSAWSPDGQKIAFECGIPGVTQFSNQDLCVINSDGTNLIRLTNSSAPQVAGHPTWSPDGTKIVFSIKAGAIATAPEQIYVVDADGDNLTQLTFEGNNCCPTWVKDSGLDQDGKTELVSIASDGTQGTSGGYPVEPPWQPAPSLSADGQLVVFSTWANNLVKDDTNEWEDVFVHDRQTGQTSRVSVAADGAPGNSWSNSPAISADGRYVVFTSGASNLVDDDTNDTCAKDGYPNNNLAEMVLNCADVFVYDRQLAEISRVSVASDGSQGNGAAGPAAISADGWYVAFWSKASNLVGDTNETDDVFVHDRQSGQTSRVSVRSDGRQANGFAQRSFFPWSGPPAISTDGRYVAFWSDATNLAPDDTNQLDDVFIHDRQTGQTSRLSIASDGAQANGRSGWPSISADGSYVAFTSEASNLISDDLNEAWDIFVHDRQSGETSRVSVAAAGTSGNGQSDYPAISADGHYVAFSSAASNLVSTDTNESWDVFLYDRQTGQTDHVSIALGSTPGDDSSFSPAISPDGRYVTFWSKASNLVEGDANGEADVFVRDRGSRPEPPMTEATIGDITFAADVTSDHEPINPGIIFEEGITKIHAIFDYRGMSKDYTWERVWNHDGQEQLRSSTQWTDPDSGRFDYTLDASGAPLPTGEWLLKIFVQEKLLATGAFTIAGKAVATITPTPTPTSTVAATPQPPPPPRVYQLAYSKWDGGFHNVYIADTNGKNERLLIKRAAGPSWSVDGKQLFFLGQQGVNQQYAPDGRLDCDFGTISDGIVALDIPPGNADICAVYYGAWKCERKQIDVQSPPSDVCEQDGYRVFQNLDWKEGTARWANVAPDSSAVAYDAKPGGTYRTYFRSILNNAQYHFELDGEQADWSPDSQRLVYRSGRDGKQGLWISNRDDTNHVNITINGTDSFPAWSPDGKTIAFSREEGGNVDIYTVNVDGSNLKRLTDAPGPDSLPTYTPSGEIIFRSARSGNWGIWKMNGNGANQREIIPNAGVASDWAYSRMDVR